MTGGAIADSTMTRLHGVAAEQPHPLVFATVSGAHLYGFASADSDFDLRGVHVLPLRDVVGLMPTRETIEVERIEDGLELDLVTHDAKKFVTLLLRPNGYVLEQLLSPLVVMTSPAHEELVKLSAGCVTRHHAHHYLGFADTQWRLFEKESPRRVKPLLYVYRVLLTGLHLMRTGQVEANLRALNETFRLLYIDDLIAQKTGGAEKQTLAASDFAPHEREFARLVDELRTARETTSLPDAPTAHLAINDWLTRLRLAH